MGFCRLRWAIPIVACQMFALETVNPIHAAEPALAPLVSGNVGMPLTLEQYVISGPELEVLPITDEKQPVVLRIESVWPHGTDFRYDFSFYGLEPGSFDLRTLLKRKDGSTMEGIHPIPIEIKSKLKDEKAEPAPLKHHPIPVPGGYKGWMKVVGTLWVLGLAGILWSMRKQKKIEGAIIDKNIKLSLGEKLEPLVKLAASGAMSGKEKAELERLLLTYWNKRLKLENTKPSERIQALKKHSEAGVLIGAIEKWLHSPDSASETEIQNILKPYRDIQWDEEFDRHSAEEKE